MDAMKALADTNIKISEAKVSLMKLKELESSYLSDREHKALLIIEKVITDSEFILKEAKGNYEKVEELYKTVSEFSSFLASSHEGFSKMLEDFEKKNQLWTASLNSREEQVNQFKEQLRVDQIRIKNDRESIQRKEEILRQDRRRIEDERATLERTIIRIKQGKI